MSDTPKTDQAEASALEVGQWHLAKLSRQLERENAALRKAICDVDVVAEHSRDDGHREWWSGGYWLHTGEMLVCMDRAAIDAARNGVQP